MARGKYASGRNLSTNRPDAYKNMTMNRHIGPASRHLRAGARPHSNPRLDLRPSTVAPTLSEQPTPIFTTIAAP